jgi:tetratricopeptide (TPR) repeat protein
MTSNHHLLYHLAEKMLEEEKNMLLVDDLFDDNQIGDFVKSIQIDSPYQQLLFEGVLTELVKEERLYVTFTLEGYFHYVLGEVLHTNSQKEGGAYLINLMSSSNLKGLEIGVSLSLDSQVRAQEFSSLATFYQATAFKISVICVGPMHTALTLFRTHENLKFWFAQLTNNQVELLHLVRKKMVYLGKRDILWEFDNFIWDKFSLLSMPNLAHLYLLCPQLSNKVLNEIEIFYSKYQSLKNQQIEEQSSSSRVQILEELGRAFLKYSEKKIALSCYVEAMELANSPETKLHLKSHVAQINKSLSNTDRAIQYYKEVIEESNSIHLWNIEAATKLRLGEIYKQQNNFLEADPFFSEVITIYRKRYGNYHTETARALGYLGSYHIYQKSWEEAKDIIKESMQIRMIVLGENNTKTCISYVNYAEILMELGDLEKSQYYLEKALLIRTNKFGSNHQDVAYTLFGLGNLFLKKENISEAKKNHQDAYEIRKIKLGLAHIFTQQSRIALLHIYGKLNDLESFLKIKKEIFSQDGIDKSKQESIDKIQINYFN